MIRALTISLLLVTPLVAWANTSSLLEAWQQGQHDAKTVRSRQASLDDGPLVRIPVTIRLGGKFISTTAEHVNRQEYLEIRDTALELIRRFPPNKYFYLGLGRSPTPLIAFIQQLLPPGNASNMPGTSIGGLDPDRFEKSFWGKKLSRHFARHLPSNKTLGGRKLLLVDYAATGGSLTTMERMLGQFLERKGMGDRLAAVAITDAKTRIKDRNGKLLPVVDPRAHSHGDGLYGLGERIFRRGYRLVAQYGSYKPKRLFNLQRRRGNYRKFSAALKTRMTADPALLRLLPGLQRSLFRSRVRR